uniref:Putative secreted protein n=1 Tax=Anopheles marajoara TaxID=58244 RepID=A0A2M4C6I5_9DIPT
MLCLSLFLSLSFSLSPSLPISLSLSLSLNLYHLRCSTVYQFYSRFQNGSTTDERSMCAHHKTLSHTIHTHTHTHEIHPSIGRHMRWVTRNLIQIRFQNSKKKLANGIHSAIRSRTRTSITSRGWVFGGWVLMESERRQLDKSGSSHMVIC